MFTKYPPKKDFIFRIVFFTGPLLAWAPYLAYSDITMFFVGSIVTVLFLWIWFGTGYTMDDEVFIYKCGPFRKKIPVNSIIQIKQNVSSWVGIRPALTFKYLCIRYNQYDEVFIAPEDEVNFIEDLIKKNPEIKDAT